MGQKEIRELLRKQLQLLSERSIVATGSELAKLTDSMCNLVNYMAIVGFEQD